MEQDTEFITFHIYRKGIWSAPQKTIGSNKKPLLCLLSLTRNRMFRHMQNYRLLSATN